jgi:hypothetical protein
MLPENPVMVVVGVVLMLLACFATGFSGIFGRGATSPLTNSARIIIFSLGALSFVLGLLRLIRK